MRKFIAFGPALVVLITALVTLFAAPAAVRLIGHANTEASIQLARQTLNEDNVLKQIDRAVRSIADAVEPSVVHIAVEQGPSRRGMPPPGGQGSGWVYDTAGHIVTNAHVVRTATRIIVQFQDGRTVQAELVGQDPTTDVAVLRVPPAEGLFPVQRASGADLHQGDRVYAFGSPFGFKFSMSEGIISGLGRDPRSGFNPLTAGLYTNYIQTDAAVNPGNSGGPLVNVEGKVVGMNVAIATARESLSMSEGQSSGISFAIPLATIESVVEQLIKTGIVAKGYLGVTHDLSDARNERRLEDLGYHGRGVAIGEVPPNGPAGKAGIQSGDVITKINGRPITSLSGMRSAITNNQPGDRVTVDVWRSGESRSFEVTLETLPPTEVELGAVITVLRNYGLTQLADTEQGVEVAAMMRPSAAFRDGLLPEARIVAVEGKPVATADELVLALAQRGLHQGREVAVTIQPTRGGPVEVKINPR